MGCLDKIQTAQKTEKQSHKIEIHFYDHFRSYDLTIFMTISGHRVGHNRSDLAWPDPTVTLFEGLFVGKYKR